MDPFTPRPRTVGRKNNLSLSTKEYAKVTGTIASARRNRHRLEGEEQTNGYVSQSAELRWREPSFISEESFVRAPLNSRIVSGTTTTKSKGKAKEESLDSFPLELQEAMILEDLLYVLMGIEGAHITFHEDYSPEDDDALQGVRFTASKRLDPSLRDLVERILPLATYYTAISSFIEFRSHLDFGRVNHALCAALREMLKDYQTLLSQLEHAFNTSPHFTLQKLWFYVHPTLHTLSLIYQLTTELVATENSGGDSSLSSGEDVEDAARNEALGLGGAKLKAVLSEIEAGADGITVKGGEVLSILHTRMQHTAGDPAARALYGKLLRAAGRPYVETLQQWTRTGTLTDPYEEFCVKESRFINRGTLEMDYTDEYWERRYTLRDGSTLGSLNKRHLAGVPPPRAGSGRLPGGACIPPLLENWKHKVLLAGKYLNVIRECGIEVQKVTNLHDDDLAMDDERFYKFIEDDYSYANRTLLQLLLRDQGLVPRLHCLKRCFFLSHSSYLTHFLDLAHTELRKTAKAASLVKLQSLLDLALGTDAHGDDAPFREDVRVTMATTGLYEWLLRIVNVSGVIGDEGDFAGDGVHDEHHKKGKEKDEKKPMLAIDALQLDFNVKFPLSLVISRKTILRYQLLFRLLLHLKHAEQALSTMWLDQQGPVWRRTDVPPEFAAWRLRLFVLRARMLAWVQQILAFVTQEVLEPNWRAIEAKLSKVVTVDQLLRDHVDFLDTCMKECMLTSSKLLNAFSKLIVTCSTFALYSASFTKDANKALVAAETPEGDSGAKKRSDILIRFETNFNHWLSIHVSCVQFYASSENVSLLPLVVRLNSIRPTS
ncbi:Spc98 family-domain-containing protein [Russula ochroleuca]|uniref:Spindle pole body component n=1 Tax=Russula ochroleuca TaxID=152965 RepID=A0A9P5N0J3_9AGAM|nr:Spc98 family-domain-containing protein [Russula ochroleuca]